jgi:hypothetical protein
MDNKAMENNRREFYFYLHSIVMKNKISFCGKQKNGKQKWKTRNNITYSQVK